MIAVIAILSPSSESVVTARSSVKVGPAVRISARRDGFSVYLSTYGNEMPCLLYSNGTWNCGFQTTALKEFMSCSDAQKKKVFQCPGMVADKYEQCYKIGYCWFYGKREAAVSRPSSKVYATDGTGEILHGQSLGDNTAIYSYGYIPGAGRYGVAWVGYENWTNNQKDFYEGRHALTNNLLYYDTHIEQKSAYTVSMEYHSPDRRVDKDGTA